MISVAGASDIVVLDDEIIGWEARLIDVSN